MRLTTAIFIDDKQAHSFKATAHGTAKKLSDLLMPLPVSPLELTSIFKATKSRSIKIEAGTFTTVIYNDAAPLSSESLTLDAGTVDYYATK